MNDRTAPQLKKWPFYVADFALLWMAVWVFSHYPHPLAPWAAGLIVGCVFVASFLALWPYRLEYDTEVRLLEASRLVSATEAIRDLEEVSQQIRQATGQWQGVQEHSGRTTDAAREIAERMTAEARAFSEFMTKANDSERSTLRLEIEKLRRGEGQWLQVLVHTLDHVHALYQAGTRSGQPNVAAQLGAFQGACRDLARRVGLIPVDADVDQAFDPSQHDIVEGQNPPDRPAQIAQVVATGFSFQGQVLRRPIVVLKELPDESLTTDSVVGESPAAQDDPVTAAHEILADEPPPAAEPGLSTVDALDDLLAQNLVAENVEPPVEFQLESEPIADEPDRQAGNA